MFIKVTKKNSKTTEERLTEIMAQPEFEIHSEQYTVYDDVTSPKPSNSDSSWDWSWLNGLGWVAVTKILTEIGPDLSRLPTVKHSCTWLGLSPGTKINEGKVLSSKTKRSVNRGAPSP